MFCTPETQCGPRGPDESEILVDRGSIAGAVNEQGVPGDGGVDRVLDGPIGGSVVGD